MIQLTETQADATLAHHVVVAMVRETNNGQATHQRQQSEFPISEASLV